MTYFSLNGGGIFRLRPISRSQPGFQRDQQPIPQHATCRRIGGKRNRTKTSTSGRTCRMWSRVADACAAAGGRRQRWRRLICARPSAGKLRGPARRRPAERSPPSRLLRTGRSYAWARSLGKRPPSPKELRRASPQRPSLGDRLAVRRDWCSSSFSHFPRASSNRRWGPGRTGC